MDNSGVDSPNAARLAAEGGVHTAITSSPVCTPSRAAAEHLVEVGACVRLERKRLLISLLQEHAAKRI